jgi:endonuclease/exonuclease/phosphatase family metal-dependent hydrolase
MTGDDLKILSANVGYLLDYDGSYGSYLRRPHRALLGSAAAEQRALERLVDVIDDERPDVVCLIEVDQGSFRTATDGQVEAIADACRERGIEYVPSATSKYGAEGILPNLPVLEHLSNGLLAQEGIEVRAHYLDTGPKRLVKEVCIDDELSLFLLHLAMRSTTRRRQLEEVADLVADRERTIVCGDFNPYDGLDELEVLTRGGQLKRYAPGPTVPKRPLDFLVTETRTFDLFLATPDVTVTRCEVIDVQVSDHRPIVLEVEGVERELGAPIGSPDTE